MVGILYFVGALIIVVGVLAGVLVPLGLPFIGGSIVSGIFLMALGRIVELLEKIERKLPGQLTSQTQQVQEYTVSSSDFEVYESRNETYRFFTLDGDDFIQARVFKHYMELHGESIVFKLPNQEQREWIKEPAYHASAHLFTRDHIVFVRLSSLNIKASRLGDSIVLSYSDSKIFI
ncbi:hypothetical protein [Paenibacillus sp. OAS669]|uniref:hypothetical protein n=1 Tax=Paenibacillus sp. OAS669 TaxID=2663821 RepID=UPI00178AEA8C|nr:hypothetical protein [Paenibacillus sp. OAS669]MBE1442276.1 hypothetical protein [Paenibacillus sp. OAS669]